MGNVQLKKSFNDDLESFIEDLQLGWKNDFLAERHDYEDTYFLPKLTEKELELVEKKRSKLFRDVLGSGSRC